MVTTSLHRKTEWWRKISIKTMNDFEIRIVHWVEPEKKGTLIYKGGARHFDRGGGGQIFRKNPPPPPANWNQEEKRECPQFIFECPDRYSICFCKQPPLWWIEICVHEFRPPPPPPPSPLYPFLAPFSDSHAESVIGNILCGYCWMCEIKRMAQIEFLICGVYFWSVSAHIKVPRNTGNFLFQGLGKRSKYLVFCISDKCKDRARSDSKTFS